MVRVQGLGFRVYGQGLGLKVRASPRSSKPPDHKPANPCGEFQKWSDPNVDKNKE